MAYKLKVKNTGDRVIERLGHEFRPGKEVTVEVHSRRDYLTIKAPQALEVEEVKDSNEEKVSASASSQEKRSNKRG